VTQILDVRELVKEFPGVKALQGVNFDVVAGEVHCLLGPNGAGKSTLIKCISGAHEPTSGEILFMGEPLPVGDRRGRSSEVSQRSTRSSTWSRT
jgi:ribose transport system ATP-binding protein